MSKARREELEDIGQGVNLKRHIIDLKILESSKQLSLFEEERSMICEESSHIYANLPFNTEPM